VVAGCGYSGSRVAMRLAKLGHVIGITRVPRKPKFEAPFGLDMITWDFDASGAAKLPRPGLASFDVIYLVPPPAAGTTDPRILHFLEALPASPARIAYISTTGVYGDAGGAAVNEDTQPDPSTDRARRRLAAEDALRAWCEARSVEWVILRVPGIYGPGRMPVERLRRGEPVLALPEAAPGNRIHVDDLADACVAALMKPQARNRIYNVGDGDHMSNTAFLSFIARLTGLPPPPQLPMSELKALRSEAALSFLSESRRVDTSRLRQELGFTPRYANPEHGIRASLAGR
jgi:nucleoside-diphosphate-sugar epimerase